MRILKVFLIVLILCACVFSLKAFFKIQKTPLPAQADDSFKRGLTAAKQQEWALAIKYFKQAQEKAPFYSPLIFNLALAYDKAGGKDLSSLTWYKAYLVLEPQTANARQINQRIAELDKKVRAEANELIARVKEPITLLSRKDATVCYKNIVLAQISLGDLSQALATVKNMPGHVAYKEPSYSLLAEALSREGRVEEARQLSEEIRGLGEKQDAADALDAPYWAKKGDDVLVQMFWGRVEAGDFKGAKEAVDSIKDHIMRQSSTLSLIIALVKDGNVAMVKEVAAQIDKNDNLRQAGAYALLAQVEAESGDLLEAKKSLELARSNAAKLNKLAIALDEIYEYIAKAQVAMDDFNGAKETIKLIHDGSGADNEDDLGGVGVYIDIKDGVLIVSAPAEDMPAWKAGIKADDRIVKIDSEPTSGMAISDAAKRLKGKPGTPVEITVSRGPQKETLVFDLIRVALKTENKAGGRKPSIYYAILKKYLKNKDVVSAKSMLMLTDNMPEATMDILEAQLKADDIQGARETAKNIRDKRFGFLVQSLIAKAQGRIKEAKIYEIYALTNYNGFAEIEDMSDSLRVIDKQDPNTAVNSIITMAKNMGLLLKELNEIETKYDKT